MTDKKGKNMEERIKVSSVKNPEYPIIKEYVAQAFLEERDMRPLSRSHRRLAGFVARYIAIFSNLIPSKQIEEITELNGTVLSSRGPNVWVKRKAKELLPGWMEARQILTAASYGEVDIVEQEGSRLRKLGEEMVKENA